MKILPIFIPNAGCPGGCVFCDQRLNSGVRHAPTPLEVSGLLAQALSGKELDQVAFYGGSFTALSVSLQEKYLATVGDYIAAGQVGGIRVSTRPDRLSRDCVVRLRHFNVDTVELGCQSFSDEVLQASGRECCSEAHTEAVGLLRRADLEVGIQLMSGLPGSNNDEACDSLQKALQLKPDFLRIYPTLVLAGTRLETDWREGRYLPQKLESAVELCADMALMCHVADVPILRFGLQSSDELDSGAVLAGPYHPAFGALVQSCLWLRALLMLPETGCGQTVQVHPHDLSAVLGQRRVNLERINIQRPELKIETSNKVPRGLMQVQNNLVEMMALAAGNG